MTKIGIALATVSLALGLAACSGTDTTDAGTTSSGLSKSYTTNCNRCHGPKGEGAGRYPRIPGDKASDAAYIAFVRGGKGEMPAFDASQISDADLKADYLWLTTQR